MTVLDLVSEFTSVVAMQATSKEYSDGHLLTLPWSLGDGEAISLYVEQVADDAFNITDRGLAADTLALAGVDLSNKSRAASWDAVRQSLTVPPAVLREHNPLEISGSSDRAGLGQALTHVAEAVLRADALRVLAAPRPTLTFPETVIRRASDRSLGVVPRAQLRTRFGSNRTVTCRVEGTGWAYVQALSAGPNFNDAYDHARSIFGDSPEPPEHLVSVVADAARPKPWQLDSLAQISTVVQERDQDELWRSLAA